jgi:hypothetical protein
MRRYTPDESDNHSLALNGLTRITPFPIGDQVSQGIGIRFHDFLVPLRGPEQFEASKDVEPVSGSVETSLSEKRPKVTHSSSNQEGFGEKIHHNPMEPKTESQTDSSSGGNQEAAAAEAQGFVPINESKEKQAKLGNVFKAMKQATYKTNEFTLKPKVPKKKQTPLAPLKRTQSHLSLHRFKLE